MAEHKCIIVLGGGITPNGGVPEWVKRRLDIALSLYKNFSHPKKIICSSGVSFHMKPKIAKNKIIYDATACAKYLLNHKIKYSDIYQETTSSDTIGNAYYCFTNFLIPMEIKDVVIITSAFHMKRSKEIFLWMNKIFDSQIKMTFIKASDQGLDPEMLNSRIQRERKSLNNLLNVEKNINNKKELVEWLYQEHNAYSSLYLTENLFDHITKEELASY